MKHKSKKNKEILYIRVKITKGLKILLKIMEIFYNQGIPIIWTYFAVKQNNFLYILLCFLPVIFPFSASQVSSSENHNISKN